MDELIKLLSKLKARRDGFIHYVEQYSAAVNEIDSLMNEIEDQLRHNGCKKVGEHWVGGDEE